MGSVFTNFVGALKAGPDTARPELFDSLLENLRRALVHEMRRKSLWSTSPSYLGLSWGRSWSDGDVLEDLLLDCYQFIFIHRLGGLMKQLEARSNIDGLIFLNIRNFLHDVQRRHDPLGYRLFELLHGALTRLLDDGILQVVSGETKIRNQTVLAFSPLAEVRASKEQLDDAARAWNDELMPELVTAWVKDDLIGELARRVTTLADSGVEAFRFQDLIDALKEDARARWRSIGWAEEGEVAPEDAGDTFQLVRLVRPDSDYEERQFFQALLDCVEDRLERLDERARTRDYLARLWFFIRTWAAESGTDDASAERPTAGDPGERFPAHKPLGERLGIPRARLPGLLSTLGGLIEDCRRAVSRPSAVSGGVGGRKVAAAAAVAANRMEDRAQRFERLRRQTLELAARSSDELLADGEPGGLYLHPATRRWPIFWLLLETRSGACRIAPVDDHPTCGGGDLRAASDRSQVVRLSLAHWVDRAALTSAIQVGRWPAEDLELARLRLAALDRGEHQPSASARRDARDPFCRDWLDEVAAASRALTAGAGDSEGAEPVDEPAATVLPFPQGERPRRRALGSLAALFAAATLGLAFWSLHLRDELAADRSRPRILDITDHDFEIQRDANIESLAWDGVEEVMLRLDMLEVEPASTYRLELYDPAQRLVWDSGELTPRLSYSLLLPHQFLERALDRGVFVLRIYGRDEELRREQEKHLEDVRLQIVEPDPARLF